METAGFLYLNVANRWPGFRWRGLERGADGALRLAHVPLYAGTFAGLESLPAPDGAAGIAVGPDGTIYFTDPGSHRLMRIDACDQSLCPVPCLNGPGSLPGELRAPRGVIVHPRYGFIVIADSGNHRLQIVHRKTFQVLGIWGAPGAEPGELDTPWTLAADSAGSIYVVDYGNRRLQKFDVRGDVVPAFWDEAASAGVDRPAGVACGRRDGADEIFVLDAGARRVAVFDTGGHLLRTLALPEGDFLGVAHAEGSLYVGDDAGRRLLRLLPVEPAAGGPLTGNAIVGEAEGFEGPVAALAAGDDDALWVHPGGSATPVRLERTAGHVRSGVAWGGPFGTAGRPTLWHEVEIEGGPLSSGAHLQLFVGAGSAAATPTDPIGDPLAPFRGEWTALPPDALRGLVRGQPSDLLWIGMHLAGEGRQTPVVRQVRVDYDTETWSRHLPAIYRTQARDPELLERFLALYESAFTDLDERIDALRRLFDPAVAPAAWLPWLGGWLGIELDETWAEEKQRRAVANAYAAAAARGTPAGLREAVRFATGVDIRIVEPVLNATWWTLPRDEENSASGGRLGFDTVLAPVELGGAVVGTTAVVDGSYLAGEDGPGSHLYEMVAHQFCVHVYERQVASPAQLAAVRAVIEREKPAHTSCHLCVIRPRMRIGVQARLGVDTVIGGAQPAQRLGRGSELVLGGDPPGRVGEKSRIGIDTRLAAAAVSDSAQISEEASWP